MLLHRITAAVVGAVCALALAAPGKAAPAESQFEGKAPAPAGAIPVGPGTTRIDLPHSEKPEEWEPVAAIVTVEVPEISTNACKQAKAGGRMVNAFGVTLWTYEMKVDWCWAGNRVTSISPPQIKGHVEGHAAFLGWEYQGVKDKVQWDYYGNKWVYRSWSQGSFKLCPPRVVCVQSVYPELTIDTYGNGHHDWWYGT